MKKILLLLALLALPAASFGQGQLLFQNDSQTLITTNSGSASGSITGLRQYRIGLYIGAPGSDEGSLSLIAVATNSTLSAGRFSYPVAPLTISGNTGTPIAFQVRAWSLSGGETHAQAVASGSPSVYAGVSAIGTITPGGVGGSPVPAVMGTSAGQVGGFVLTPVPEPSTIALGLLGLGAIALFRRRK